MSDGYDNTNSGALFKNDKEDHPNWPDYKGSINVDGTEFWLSAWLKKSKAGKNYMSLSVEPKEQKSQEMPKFTSQGGGKSNDPFANGPDFGDAPQDDIGF
jgi:uncharacterized protein (DUF736 family)